MDELSEIIRMDKRTIQNRVSNNQPLPPSFKLPSTKTRLWRYKDVMNWINQKADEFIKKEQAKRDEFDELTNIINQPNS
ncbi:MAG: hypothetical protein Q9M14_00250 [Mariprofundaceae bacterium]|nr:hypothetical protein [Mariprofundaceae bacterium]